MQTIEKWWQNDDGGGFKRCSGLHTRGCLLRGDPPTLELDPPALVQILEASRVWNSHCALRAKCTSLRMRHFLCWFYIEILVSVRSSETSNGMSFSRFMRFECEEDGIHYFADLGPGTEAPPSPGTQIQAFTSYNDFESRSSTKTVTFRRVSHAYNERPVRI